MRAFWLRTIKCLAKLETRSERRFLLYAIRVDSNGSSIPCEKYLTWWLDNKFGSLRCPRVWCRSWSYGSHQEMREWQERRHQFFESMSAKWLDRRNQIQSFVTRESSSSTLLFSPSKRAKKLACVLVVPLTPLKPTSSNGRFLRTGKKLSRNCLTEIPSERFNNLHLRICLRPVKEKK